MKRIIISFLIVISTLSFIGCSVSKMGNEQQKEVTKTISDSVAKGDSSVDIELKLKNNYKKMDSEELSKALNWYYQSVEGDILKSYEELKVINEDCLKLIAGGKDLNNVKDLKSIDNNATREILFQIKERHHSLVSNEQSLTAEVNNQYFIDTYGEYITKDLLNFFKFKDIDKLPIVDLSKLGENTDIYDFELLIDKIIKIESLLKDNEKSVYNIEIVNSLQSNLKLYYGINHTDFIEVETFKFNDDVLEGYKKIVDTHKDDKYGSETQEYLDLIKSNEGKRTEKITADINAKIEKLSMDYINGINDAVEPKDNDNDNDTVENK